MTETEKQQKRELKAKVCTLLKGADLSLIAPILDTDERIRTYVMGVLQDMEAHNLYELLGLWKMFGMRQRGRLWSQKKVQHFLKVTEQFLYVDESGARHIKWSPIQTFMWANIFGWRMPDGRRLIRYVTIFIPRKFGKTSMIAGLADYEMLYGPANAQVYVAGNSYQQSKICFDMMRNIALDLDPNDKFFHVNREQMWFKSDSRQTTAAALSDNPKKLDGLNASMVIMDEYSQARNTETKSGAALKNVLTSSMGARQEPLTIILTTASEVMDGPFKAELDGTLAELEQSLSPNPSPEEGGETDTDADFDNHFASIFMPDVDDEYGDPKTWQKVQPHMSVTVREENYLQFWKDAQRSADDMLTFRTKQLNIFCVNEQESWIPASDIQTHQTLPFDIENDKQWNGRLLCNVGIDLSVHDDFSCVTYMLYDKTKRQFLSQTMYYLPEDVLENHRNAALYKVWHEQGYLRLIPGKVNDPAIIAGDIIKMSKKKHLNIQHIGYDPYKSEECVASLKAWLHAQGVKDKAISNIVIPFSQSIGNFNKPLETFELAFWQGRIQFHKDPMTPWCFGNAVIMQDNNQNKKPTKRVPHLKIDATITNIMSLGLFYN